MSHIQLFLLYAPITLLLPTVLSWYVGRNLLGPLVATRCAVYVTILLMFVAGLAASLALLYWSEQDRTPIGPLVRVGFGVMGYLLTATSLLLLRDALRAVLWLAFARQKNEPAEAVRKVLASGWILFGSSWAMLAIAAGCVAWGMWGARQPPVVEEFPTPLRNLPDAFRDYRIAHLTDLHLRGNIDQARLRDLVAQVNSLDVDLIAITGDVVDGPLADLRAELSALGELRARDGVYLALGNHENYADVDACVAEFRRFSFHVLLNDHVVVTRGLDRVVVAGVTNPRRGMHGGKFTSPHGPIADMDSEPHRAVAQAPTGVPRILLAHQPISVKQARGLHFDLALVGHTHGGQFFPWNLAVLLVFPYSTGLQRDGSTWVHVGRGIGTFGPPLRLGSSPQIAVVELRNLTSPDK